MKLLMKPTSGTGWIQRVLVCSVIALNTFILQAKDVATFPAPDVAFSQYKTYQWLPVRIATKTGIIENDERISPMIRTSVTKQLNKIGWTETTTNPDLKISTGAMQDASVQLEAIIYSMAPAGLDWAYGAPVMTLSRYNRTGTLIVNLIDTKSNKSVWLGVATKGLGTPDQAAGKIESASEKLFKKFPARVK